VIRQWTQFEYVPIYQIRLSIAQLKDEDMDAKMIAHGIWDSIKGIPQSTYYGAKRTYISTGALGYDRQRRNERENERFYQVVKSLASNEEPLRRLPLS